MKTGPVLIAFACALAFGDNQPAAAYPAPDTVICRVTYQPGPDGNTQYTDDKVSVKTSELPTLPTTAPVKKLVPGSFGLPNFHGTLQDETDKEVITYAGQFTALVANELFLPHGAPIVLRPQIYFPATTNDGAPEIYTNTEQPGLRAVWMRTPIFGNNAPLVETRYFAVLVQLYDYVSQPMRCRFTGTRTVKAKSFWSDPSTQNLTNADITFTNAPQRKISIYPAISAMHL
jgi:hypothetical protein